MPCYVAPAKADVCWCHVGLSGPHEIGHPEKRLQGLTKTSALSHMAVDGRRGSYHAHRLVRLLCVPHPGLLIRADMTQYVMDTSRCNSTVSIWAREDT